ncbi:LCP family protein [Anaerosinus massiliensis]|uniref:LCP family protein n=1 Tax=Massilibacillus massiliensis TaxID=1806837 RepID=UPI000A7972F0|nr:LCP family protein [Massilibacillus massiliensis]
MGSLQERVKKQRKNRSRRILTIVLILFIFMATVGASYYWFDSRFFGNKRNVDSGMMVAQDKMNIMIMGVDKRADDVGRSDTLMVATVDPGKKEASILSIPRDTRVKISGHGYDKINHAYAFGGHNLTKDSVENLLGVPMDYYILIDIKAFTRIIDAIGGVDIDVEKRMYYEDPYDDSEGHPLVINLRPGMQHMNGETAIQYVRYRDEEGDIGRIARQQKFMKAVMDKVVSPSIITKLPTIIQEVSSAVETDMSVSKMISLVSILKDAKDKGLKTTMVPGKPAYIQDISYWLPDVVALRQGLAQSLDIKMDDKIVRAMKQEADEYETSIPKEMKVLDTPKETKKEVEQDKKKEEPKKDDKTAKDKDAEKKSASKTPETIRVEVVNASGVDGAGAEVAAILRRRGFVVTGVSTLTAPYKNTVIRANTENEGVADKFSSLPFKYSLQSGGDGSQATVIIGKDYTK